METDRLYEVALSGEFTGPAAQSSHVFGDRHQYPNPDKAPAKGLQDCVIVWILRPGFRFTRLRH